MVLSDGRRQFARGELSPDERFAFTFYWISGGYEFPGREQEAYDPVHSVTEIVRRLRKCYGDISQNRINLYRGAVPNMGDFNPVAVYLQGEEVSRQLEAANALQRALEQLPEMAIEGGIRRVKSTVMAFSDLERITTGLCRTKERLPTTQAT